MKLCNTELNALFSLPLYQEINVYMVWQFNSHIWYNDLVWLLLILQAVGITRFSQEGCLQLFDQGTD
jgi:hypothetical protein